MGWGSGLAGLEKGLYQGSAAGWGWEAERGLLGSQAAVRPSPIPPGQSCLRQGPSPTQPQTEGF